MEENICTENLSQLIHSNMAFLIKTVTNVTHRYVSVENDDEFSVALMAFSEAVEKYDSSKGAFFPYARLVIESRLKNYLNKNNHFSQESSLELMEENGMQFEQREDEDDDMLKDEVMLFKQELQYFSLSLEDLVETAPKHFDTRMHAFHIGQHSSENKEIVDETYHKRKLAIRKVAVFNQVSEKVVKGSKHFILATMILFVKKFPQMQLWLKDLRCSHDL